MAAVGEDVDEPAIEHENPSRVVWALAWPAVALNSLQVVNTLLDRGFIGHLEQAALTAHGGAMNVLFLMFSLAIALATGATALVSRAFGAGEEKEYRKASREALRLSIIFGILAAAITAAVAPYVSALILPETDRAAIRLMSDFVLVYSAGLPAIYIIQVLAGSLRGIGDTKSPMVISGVQILLHILLNFLLIFPPRDLGFMVIPGAGWGLVGAGAALSISAWLSAVAYIVWTRNTPLGQQFSLSLPERSWAVRILKVAIPAALMAILRVFSLTAFTLVLAVAPRGSVAIGAMSTGFAIESLMFMPSFGLSAAAGALVGQSLGMKRPDRAERLGWVAGHHAAFVTLALAGPIFVLSPSIATALLGSKPEMIAEAASLIRYLCITEVMFAYAMVLLGAMQGAGDTVRPMWISIFALWGLRVPLALFLTLSAGQRLGPGIFLPFGFGLGATGAWLSMALTQGIQGLMSIVAFKQGAWKLKKV